MTMDIRKKDQREKDLYDAENIVKDFTLRTPFNSYRPTEYREYETFFNFKNEIDEYLESLFEGEIDDGNGDVLDNMINDMARQAEKDLEKQHTEHGDTIKSFEIRHRADKLAFENERNLLCAKINENECQLNEIILRIKNEKFLGGYKYEK